MMNNYNPNRSNSRGFTNSQTASAFNNSARGSSGIRSVGPKKNDSSAFSNLLFGGGDPETTPSTVPNTSAMGNMNHVGDSVAPSNSSFPQNLSMQPS